MALSNEDLLKELSAKPILEVVELVKMLEEEWGVSAAAPVAVAAAGGAARYSCLFAETYDKNSAELPADTERPELSDVFRKSCVCAFSL